jgi:hypothetical protein
MTNAVIKFKRSSVPGKIPLPEDLQFGEVAINDYDGTMYYKKADGTIGALGSGGGASDALIQQIANEKAIIMAIALG